MTDTHVDVAIVGAGFCGLATAASLKTAGVSDFVVFEQGPEVGDFWSRTYDRLRLHSPWHDLPHDGGLSVSYPMYKSRTDLVRYFTQYVEHFGLRAHLRCNERVAHIRRIEPDTHHAEWSIETAADHYRARFIAIATAINRAPIIPSFSERERYEGALLHSSSYRNPAPFRSQRILVVGSGNSAAEIALDLVERGGADVSLWVRGPRHFIPITAWTWVSRIFRALGLLSPAQFDKNHRLTTGTPDFEKVVKLRDAVPRCFSVDLSTYGIRKPRQGPLVETFMTGRIPVFDQGAIHRIRRGDIRVVDGNQRPIVHFTRDGVRLGTTAERFDAVILATGFEPGLEQFVDDRDLLGAVRWRRSFPLTDGRCRSRIAPSAFFPGFDPSVNGGLSLGRWGWEVGERIAADLQPASRPQRRLVLGTELGKQVDNVPV